MKISVIIPALNEEENIRRVVQRIAEHGGAALTDLMVVDGGSSDKTVEIAREAGATVVQSPAAGRAAQMNFGAQKASGDILYFVHSDTLPPETFISDIKTSLEADFPVGCYRYVFDSPKKILRINGYFTRFNKLWCRGGDQSLYIKKKIFEELNGFRNDHRIMEDFEFIRRVQARYPFRVIPKNMIVSARKYDNNSYLRVQVANLVVFNMFRFGFSQETMVKTYKRMLDYR